MKYNGTDLVMRSCITIGYLSHRVTNGRSILSEIVWLPIVGQISKMEGIIESKVVSHESRERRKFPHLRCG
jgi:hypothetical protein